MVQTKGDHHAGLVEKYRNNRRLTERRRAIGRGIELLDDDFRPLDELKKGLCERVLRYAVDGDGEEVLGELHGEATAQYALALAGLELFPK